MTIIEDKWADAAVEDETADEAWVSAKYLRTWMGLSFTFFVSLWLGSLGYLTWLFVFVINGFRGKVC